MSNALTLQKTMVQTTAQNKLGFERTSRREKKRYVSHPHTGGKQRIRD
jgi:hypothetical protein